MSVSEQNNGKKTNGKLPSMKYGLVVNQIGCVISDFPPTDNRNGCHCRIADNERDTLLVTSKRHN